MTTTPSSEPATRHTSSNVEEYGASLPTSLHAEDQAEHRAHPGATSPENTKKPRRRTRAGSTIAFIIGLAILGILIYLSMTTGVYKISEHKDGQAMYWITRFPRTISLLLAGASMAMCGLVMQLITQNKFVEPTTTGTTEWASLGLLCAYVFIPDVGIMPRMILSIIFAFGGTMVFFAFLRRVTLRSSVIVPIVGMMLGAVVSSITTFFALKTQMLQSLGTWFQGSFSMVEAGRYEPLWVVLFSAIAVFFLADRLTVAGLGQEIATSLGINYNRIVILGTAVIALTCGVITVVIGHIPFLGLVVPNIVSLNRGDDLRSNLPWVCLFGAGIIMACDLVSRTLISPFEIPVSLILGTLGAFVFIALILKQRRRLG